MITSPDSNSQLATREALERDLREWRQQRKRALETVYETGGPEADGIWGNMPAIDSKEVATARPIFEDHLNVDFDPRLVKRGGYNSVEEMIDHLVPPMMEKDQAARE